MWPLVPDGVTLSPTSGVPSGIRIFLEDQRVLVAKMVRRGKSCNACSKDQCVNGIDVTALPSTERRVSKVVGFFKVKLGWYRIW